MKAESPSQGLRPRHLQPDVEKLLRLPSKERITCIDSADFFIPYPAAEMILRRMERLFERTNLDKHVGMLIVSPPDNGKTSLLRTCEKRHPSTSNPDEDEDNIPVARVEAPPQASEKRLLGQIIKRFAPDIYASGDREERENRLIGYVRDNRVKLILIDEIHFLLNGTGNQQAECLNTLRKLTNELHVPIVLAGTESARQLMMYHPELSSRFAVYDLPVWTYGPEFVRFLVALESKMPLANQSDLASKEKAMFLLGESRGRIGKVCRIVKESAMDALEKGEERISLECLKRNAVTLGHEADLDKT